MAGERDLEGELDAALRMAYSKTIQETGYNPTAFVQMLDRDGPTQTIIKLVSRRRPSDGFVKLWEMKRLDLTVEAIAIESRWTELLPEETIKAARHRLKECGYETQSDSAVEQRLRETVNPLEVALQRVLALQPAYSSSNTPEMQERGRLIRSAVPELIRTKLGFQRDNTQRWSVEGSDGVGRKAQSAWVRIYDNSLSPSATNGWYVVLHFESSGQALFLCLSCGATTYKNGSFVAVDEAVLRNEVAWAKSHLVAEPNNELFRDIPSLGGNRLSDQFEKAIALCRRYSASEVNATDLLEATKQMLIYLEKIYSAQQLGKSPLSDDPLVVEIKQAIEAVAGRRDTRQFGQGRGLSAVEKRAVELRAMDVAREELLRLGYSNIKDCSASHSYDYEAMLNDTVFFVEVKGTTSSVGDCVLFTPAERRFHEDNLGRTVLIVVHNINLLPEANGSAAGGVPQVYAPWDTTLWAFVPTGFEVRKLNPAHQRKEFR